MNKLFLGFLTLLLLSQTGFAEVKRTEDVIYRRKFGTALTMDIFQPEKTNGYGIIFVVSGGWFSAKEVIVPQVYDSFLKRGYTVFAVVHGSQPKFQIPEIIQDMHRSVRFVRHNAAKYGIHPDKIGITGGSAGGHLSLIMGTQGEKGDPNAKDPVERESSEVQAAACFFPPTDFLNYGGTGKAALGEDVLGPFKPAFGDIPTEPAAREKFGKSISPIYSITAKTAPTFLIHGDADTLVPLQQSETFLKQAKAAGVATKLEIKKGQAHGWADWLKDFSTFNDWFDEHLRGLKKEVGSAK